MPLYTYNPCSNPECSTGPKKAFKVRRSMETRNDPVPCPSCGESCERANNDFSTHAKCVGGGWASTGYVTDPRQVNLESDKKRGR